MLEIALASQSPRRYELLKEQQFLFRTFPVKVSEIIDENLNPGQVATGLAELKARAAIDQYKELKQQGFLVLGADTIVVMDSKVLGKPENFSQARDYLRLLSEKTHSVITGLTLLETGSNNFWTGLDETKVRFRTLTDVEIEDYIATGEPMDKAGAYGIQGGGGKFVSSFEGSWSNVVGLPLELLAKVLKENGWQVGQQSSATR